MQVMDARQGGFPSSGDVKLVLEMFVCFKVLQTVGARFGKSLICLVR